MEHLLQHLLQKSKCSIFNDIFKYIIYQKALLWSKGSAPKPITLKADG